MWGLIVVLGLVAVVILVGVLVALGMKASRAGGDDDWMAEDEQPRGRRGGRSRGRRGEGDEYDEEPYGDMRVAGAPMGPSQQLPAAPMAGPHAGPVAGAPPGGRPPLPAASAPSGRSSEEMDDDEYWSTITFDKPKFPWRQNADQQGESRGADPLGPPRHPQGQSQGQRPVQPAPPTAESIPVGPIDTPAPPTAPQPAIPSNPLDAPVGRRAESEPGGIPSYGAAEQSNGFAPYTGEQQNNGYGDDPLNTGERPAFGSRGSSLPPVTPPAPTSPPPTATQPAASMNPLGSGAEDEPRLPSVDELLAKIQSDRKRTTESESAPSSGYDPLSDPLSDPLNTGERPSYGSSYGSSSYGGSSSTSSAGVPSAGSGWSSSDSYGSDPLSGGYSSGSGGGYGSSSSSSYDSGYGSSSGYSSGDSSRYGSSPPSTDDPLGTGYSGSSSGGYSSSGYYGSNPQEQQSYDSGAIPSHPSENTTQAYPTSPYGNSYGSSDHDQEKRPEDWNSYGDYRR